MNMKTITKKESVLHPIYKTQEHVPNKSGTDTRFILGSGFKNPLIVLGINPSVATENDMDYTVTRIKGYAERNNYDHYIIINIYAQVQTDPNKMHDKVRQEIHQQNLKEIEALLKLAQPKTILAAWGQPVVIKPFLKSCLKDILALTNKHKITWQCTGTTKLNHPRHPSRGAYRPIVTFDLDAYSKKFL
jgi:hypothetical protein